MDITALYQIFLGCTGVTTDSRNCPKGSLFIALKGDNFNGNAFAAKALEAGSAYAIVDEADYVPAGDTHYILVDVLDIYPIDTSKAHGDYMEIKINGMDAEFSQPLAEHDDVILRWVTR